MFKNVVDGKLEHDGKVDDVKMAVGAGVFFVLEDSLPQGLIPKVGDKILWNFEVDHFNVVQVIPLIAHGQMWSSYALKVDLD